MRALKGSSRGRGGGQRDGRGRGRRDEKRWSERDPGEAGIDWVDDCPEHQQGWSCRAVPALGPVIAQGSHELRFGCSPKWTRSKRRPSDTVFTCTTSNITLGRLPER